MKDQRLGDRNPRDVFKVGSGTPHIDMGPHTAGLHHQAGGNGTAAIIPSAVVTSTGERVAVGSDPEPGAPSPEDWTRAMRLVNWYLELSAPPVPAPAARPAGLTEDDVVVGRSCDEG